MKPTKAKPSPWRHLGLYSMYTLGGMVIISLCGVITYLGYEYYYKNKLYPGVTIAGQALGGKTYPEVAVMIDTYKTELTESGLQFHYADHTYTAPVAANDESDPSVTVPIVAIATDETAQAAFALGRGDDTVQNLLAKLRAVLVGYNVAVRYTVDQPTLQALLSAEFDEFTTPYQDATLVFADDGSVTVQSHSDGQHFPWADVLTSIEEQLAALEPMQINLTLETNPAPVTTTMAERWQDDAEATLSLAPITLTYEDHIYTVERSALAGWLTLSPDGLALHHDVVDQYLDTIAGEIDIPVQEGRFSLDIIAGAVQLQQFQSGQDGLAVNTEKTLTAIEQAILRDHTSGIAMVVEVTHPRATPDNLDDLGIKELLGTGETNFAGSPYNRIMNIRKGADHLNGLLIAPGETFSLLSVLSPIDLAHGWLSELVIKGDKLEKEAGGGLCQIGTTSFRAAMLSGLPIVERRNHSWAVSYYNYNGKAGVDATIYEPSPDFRFTNDTGHYILWRSRIEGSDIYFELWGTSDGRKGSFTEPTNYGYVSPGPTEEVVDESLPPGTRDCVQHAYTGVSAAFDYIVDWADGRKDVTTYTSTYRARPARCLIGPEETVTETTETTDEASEETTVDDADSNKNTNNDSANSNTNKKKKKDDR